MNSITKGLMTNEIVVAGYGVVPPKSFLESSKGFGSEVQPLSRRHKRFACRAGEHAITAGQLAFDMAGVDPALVGKRFGFYTNQAGLQHGDIDDYQSGFEQISSGDPVLNRLWESKSTNPFLAIKGLSNNLLGLASLIWGLRGDCGAFVRDQVGAATALDEAVFNIQQGYIDSALVLSAGTVKDVIELKTDNPEIACDELEPECGAVAILLQKRGAHTKALAALDTMSCEYDFEANKGKTTANSSAEPRWGGILFRMAHVLHTCNANGNSRPVMPNNTAIHVNSYNASGFHAQASMRMIQGD